MKQNQHSNSYACIGMLKNLRQKQAVRQGISQDGTSVRSINLVSTPTTVNYGDALLVQRGSYTRTDASTGQAGSFILAQNNFTTSFTPIPNSEAAKALPAFKGSGWVRDLQEAANEEQWRMAACV